MTTRNSPTGTSTHYAILRRLVGVAIAATVLAVAWITTTPRPWALTILGMGLGCVSGYLGARAIRNGGASNAARALTWACGIGLLILAMAVAVDMFVGAWAASFAGYLFVASVIMLAALLRKQRLEVVADGT